MRKIKLLEPVGQDRIEEVEDVLTDLCRKGAREMLATALNAEVEAYLVQHAGIRDENNRRSIVRNGYMPERSLQTGLGNIKIRQPRVEDRRQGVNGERKRFNSQILPPYLRKTKQLEELIPWLYLKGISSGDFSEALAALVGADAKGLSANTVMRLKNVWAKEWEVWNHRTLVGKEYVYFWVDGVYFNVRLEEDRSCILVVMGATKNGKKELVAVQDGYRESAQSWKELLLDLKQRGLETGPKLAIGDGALGFWKALPQVFGKCRWQRCWLHKMVNVMNYMAKSAHVHAKALMREIWMAETKSNAEKAFAHFVATYAAKYPKAVECLTKDRENLLTFYDFPAEHWKHIRTTNPIESTFATVRLRTYKTKGCGTRVATLLMVFKLVQSAERHWRCLDGHQLLVEVMKDSVFEDGLLKLAA
jgi:transposase-like protein